jgi:hypothetical protein
MIKSMFEEVPDLAARMQAVQLSDSEAEFTQRAAQDAELAQLSSHSAADRAQLLEVAIQGTASSQAVVLGLQQGVRYGDGLRPNCN